MSATFVEAFRQSGSDPSDSDWLGWLRHELAPTRAREIRTAIIVAGAVLCVIISMALQVPQLATSAYMVFFISKESKLLTKITGVGGVIVLTIGIGATLLLYKFTYGHPELRIPGMAIALFLGMWLSRVLVMGPLGFLLGFIVAVSQSVGEEVPSPELLVRGLLWLWVALAYAIALTVVLNLLFLPDTPKTVARPKPKSEPDGRSLFVPDAFTNPAHVHFAFKVTFAAMFCYIVYEAIDWSGIHTAFITCTFIALESTEATLYKGTLRIVGCVIGGALALFSIVFLIPHMETIASLVVLVACTAAIAGWVATGSIMLGCRSHSLSSIASFKVTRRIPISITSAIGSLEFFSVLSSPASSSDTFGRSARSTDCAARRDKSCYSLPSCLLFPVRRPRSRKRSRRPKR